MVVSSPGLLVVRVTLFFLTVWFTPGGSARVRHHRMIPVEAAAAAVVGIACPCPCRRYGLYRPCVACHPSPASSGAAHSHRPVQPHSSMMPLPPNSVWHYYCHSLVPVMKSGDGADGGGGCAGESALGVTDVAAWAVRNVEENGKDNRTKRGNWQQHRAKGQTSQGRVSTRYDTI